MNMYSVPKKKKIDAINLPSFTLKEASLILFQIRIGSVFLKSRFPQNIYLLKFVLKINQLLVFF